MKPISLSLYNLSGKTNGTIDLDPCVFGVEVNASLLHQAVVTHLANGRVVVAHTKDRGAVAGTGKKPWRQKGTGNARVGSARSPLWRGGGITFGPDSDRNYSKRMPQKMRQAAFRMALSSKVAGKHVLVLENIEGIAGKTKDWAKTFSQLPDAANKALIVSKDKSDMADRAIRNLPTQKYVSLEGLTIYDILRFPQLVITRDAVAGLTERLGCGQEHNKTEPTEKKTPAKAAAK